MQGRIQWLLILRMLKGGTVEALALIVLCVAAGMVTARVSHPEGLAPSLNWWVVYIALPALVLGQIVRLEPSFDLVMPALGMWLVFFGAWGFIAVVGAVLGWSRQLIGCLVLTAGLGNTAFVGYPLIEALMGKEGLAIAVVTDQFGSFFMLAVMGAVITALYSGQQLKWRDVGHKLITFPAFIALLVAIVLGRLGEMPPLFFFITDNLGSTLTPLALFSVGLQLKMRSVGGDAVPLLAGLSWKIIMAPLLVWGLMIWAGTDVKIKEVVVLQAAMAPMVTGGILAQQYGFQPLLANRMVGFGLIVSLITVPLWQQVLLLF